MTEVVLHVYDLSLGALGPLSENLLGQKVEGFWHTGIAVFGYEYFYGKTVHRKKTEEFVEMFGHEPVKKIVLGNTDIGKRQFEAHITSEPFKEKYQKESYDVLRNNCNDFCKEALDYILEEAILPEEVANILNNTRIISESPRVQTLLGLFENGKRLGFSFISKLMETTNIPSDTAALQNVLDIFSKPSVLSASTEEINLDEEEADEHGDISPEAAISGILDFFESFSDPTKQLKEPRLEENIELKTKLPPGAKSAAVNFGKNLVEAINLINHSISQAVDPSSKDANSVKGLKLKKVKEEDGDRVPLTGEVVEFIEETFDNNYEAVVVRKVRDIFEKNGYYEMLALRGVTEEELIQMGIKRGWAKKLKARLDKYFM